MIKITLVHSDHPTDPVTMECDSVAVLADMAGDDASSGDKGYAVAFSGNTNAMFESARLASWFSYLMGMFEPEVVRSMIEGAFRAVVGGEVSQTGEFNIDDKRSGLN